MGERNFLIEGVSGTGKSSVCKELRKRGYQAIDGDKELAYQGEPPTESPKYGIEHGNHMQHMWDEDKVKSIVADQTHGLTFFCGGSRNFDTFIDLFDKVFVLEIDNGTLKRRLESRPENAWGGTKSQQALILQLHQTKEDIPQEGVIIDATQSIDKVVDEIVAGVASSTPTA